MFSISNSIAYDGQMVYATAEDRRNLLPASSWLHVDAFDGASDSAVQSTGHYVRQEGAATLDILEALGPAGEDFFVITPFVSVKSGLVSEIERRFGREAAHSRVGTVHSFQGREADVVILVLGTHAGGSAARRWAANKPNLLNVAVTRAKRRLYVVGDRDHWSGLRYFDTLSDRLPDYAPFPQV